MTRFVLLCGFLVFGGCTSAQPPRVAAPPEPTSEPEPTPAETAPQPELNLYRASYGDGAHPLVFLHGGPGYNSALFEATTADALAKHGRVVIYDRRGAGRSAEQSEPPAFTFEEALVDLDRVLEGIEAPILLAHSFGGAVALRYLDARPDFKGTVVLVNVPISYPRSLATILTNCKAVYEAKKDAEQLRLIAQIEAMDPASSQYAGLAFFHGLRCGLYQPASPTKEAVSIGTRAGGHPAAAYFSDSKPGPFIGFHANEAYTSLDLTGLVDSHADRLWAVYGEEDRIISDDDRALLRTALGPRFVSIPGAAHNVFVDAQPAFLDAIVAAMAPAAR